MNAIVHIYCIKNKITKKIVKCVILRKKNTEQDECCRQGSVNTGNKTKTVAQYNLDKPHTFHVDNINFPLETGTHPSTSLKGQHLNWVPSELFPPWKWLPRKRLCCSATCILEDQSWLHLNVLLEHTWFFHSWSIYLGKWKIVKRKTTWIELAQMYGRDCQIQVCEDDAIMKMKSLSRV